MKATSFTFNYDNLQKELQRLWDMESRLNTAIFENDKYEADSQHEELKRRLSALLRTIKDGEL